MNVKKYLQDIKKLYLSPPIPEGYELSVSRQRMEGAKELLNNVVFQAAIQMMNEMLVAELADTGPLDNDTRTVLCSRLRLVSELQETLFQFINEYETIAQIQQMNLEKLQQEPEAAVNG